MPAIFAYLTLTECALICSVDKLNEGKNYSKMGNVVPKSLSDKALRVDSQISDLRNCGDLSFPWVQLRATSLLVVYWTSSGAILLNDLTMAQFLCISRVKSSLSKIVK